VRALISSLPTKDQDLLREVEPERMDPLDEDELLGLHKRIRRARNKHVKNYRRQAADAVAEHGGRGIAFPKNTRARDRAEAYEDALARGSARLEVLARQASEALKAERLAAARAGKGAGPGGGADPVAESSEGVVRSVPKKTTGGIKRDASTKAAGARRQAKRDSR